jgi:tetratricopeptide (TPR) repeat protein
VATVPGIPRRADERPSDYRDRVAAIDRQYNAGRQALAAGRAAEARDLLKAVAATAPAYKDTAELLQDAEAAVGREGAAALATAEKQEQAGDYDQAIASYRRAERLGAPPDRVSAGLQRVQRATTALAEKAFADARQFDSLGRNADAVRQYQVAVRWLPEGDPRKAQAQQRLAVLGTRRP